MPRNPLVARRYSQALAATLSDAEILKARDEFLMLHEVLISNPMVGRFLSNPVISEEEKIEVVESLAKFFPTVLPFLIATIRMGRESLLSQMAEAFEKFVEERSGELSVHLELASQDLKASEEDIRLFLQEKWSRVIKIKTAIRPELIGGFVAKGGGKVLDASVRNQLNSLRAEVLA